MYKSNVNELNLEVGKTYTKEEILAILARGFFAGGAYDEKRLDEAKEYGQIVLDALLNVIVDPTIENCPNKVEQVSNSPKTTPKNAE
jgi:hypothetical protein